MKRKCQPRIHKRLTFDPSLVILQEEKKEVLKMDESVKVRTYSTKDVVFMGVFVALMAVTSAISIPSTVPFTLQTLGVFLAVTVLGGKKGSLAITTYVILGAIGAPVFAHSSGGFGVLFGNTGGYIIGFIAAGLIMWFFEHFLGRKLYVLALGASLGMLACYVIGTAWFMYVYSRTNEPVGLQVVLGWCVYPFIVPDLLKIILALIIGDRLHKVYKRL